jgi:organic radical activating enzyme
MRKIPIYEMFRAWQGEGDHMGKAFFFIRTFGCPIKCTFCDSAGTWHPNYIPDDIQKLDFRDIVKAALDSKIPRVVITGGEPAIHDLTELVDALSNDLYMDVHIETSGTFQIKGDVDWVTVSPKWAKMPLLENIIRADEFKFIIEKPEDIEDWYKALHIIAGEKLEKHTGSFWLHPERSQCHNPVILNAISEAVMRFPNRYRAGWQIHREYQVDSLDSRSRPVVPLGGNPEKGI